MKRADSGAQGARSLTADADAHALVLVDRLASLGTLVAGVAHEINNPITYVLGNLEELSQMLGALREAIEGYRAITALDPDERRAIEGKLAQVGGTDLIQEVMGDTLEGAARIRELARDLLALGHFGDADPTTFEVHGLIDAALRLTERERREVAEVERDYQATRNVSGHPSRIGQVFLNLITNAVHACADGEQRPGLVSLRTRDSGEAIVVEVQDTGPGIDPAVADRVFEPFFTTKPAGLGTGLGLYICRNIVDQHGGSLTFRVLSTGGTLFRVRLPTRPERQRGTQHGDA